MVQRDGDCVGVYTLRYRTANFVEIKHIKHTATVHRNVGNCTNSETAVTSQCRWHALRECACQLCREIISASFAVLLLDDNIRQSPAHHILN